VLAITDELTGLYNHRYFQDELDRELKHADEELRPMSVLLIDLDGFRRVNKARGFAYGDAVLHMVGQEILATARQYDVCARFAGEEFGIVLPDREVADAEEFAERLRRQLMVALTNAGESVTVSIGVAACPDHGRTREALVKAAQRALRDAKRAGRNQVAIAPRAR
jgi:diguanylate cyclase (GGDEF)-like protein